MNQLQPSAHGVRYAPQRYLRSDMSVRQVAHDFPACRAVFVRYGEPAERTPFGHLEPLERFASRRGIPVTQLMRELSEAVGVPVAWQATREERAHRPFLTAALLITLSLGAGWGAVLLWRIGWHKNFDAVPARDVVAHGDAQLWGFIAMFIAGVALRWLPVATATRFVPDLHARIIFAGFLVGVIGGFIWALHAAAAPWLATFSSMGLTAAAYLTASFLISRVLSRGKEVWVWAVVAAGIWWVVWAVYTLYLRWKYDMLGPDSYSLIERNATIYLAVFAVALNAVFGFGLRLLPGVVGGRVDRFWAILAILLHNFSLVVYFAPMINGWRTSTLISPVGIVMGTICYCCALPGLRQLKRYADRPEQGPSGLVWYVSIALAWLILGGMLIVLGHAYELKEGVVVSHAWYGAARHALTSTGSTVNHGPRGLAFQRCASCCRTSLARRRADPLGFRLSGAHAIRAAGTYAAVHVLQPQYKPRSSHRLHQHHAY